MGTHVWHSTSTSHRSSTYHDEVSSTRPTWLYHLIKTFFLEKASLRKVCSSLFLAIQCLKNKVVLFCCRLHRHLITVVQQKHTKSNSHLSAERTSALLLEVSSNHSGWTSVNNYSKENLQLDK